jgi:hypothetical protein
MAARLLKIAGVLFGLVLVLARPGAATVLEVPLPELNGTYSCASPATASMCSNVTPIHLPAIPSVIHSVSLRVHGSTTFASYTCDGEYAPTTSPFNTGFDVELYETGGPSGFVWVASYTNAAAGPIAYSQPFEPVSISAPASWTFLLDGTATLWFGIQAVPGILECFLEGPPDSTTVDEVTLLVDGEFPTGAAKFSWGQLKLLYR